jgi:hypothetical protein
MPRLGLDSKPEIRLPLNITYAFSTGLVEYTKSFNSCGLPYAIPVGNFITESFMNEGLNRFETVQAEPPVGEAKGASPDGYRIVLTLNQFQFEATDRMGEDDRYHAKLEMEMQAVYEDHDGNPLAQTPLMYRKTLNMWTPLISGSATSCTTYQVDSAVKDAATALARDMIRVLPRVAQLGQEEPAPTTSASIPETPTAPDSTSTASAQSEPSPSVQFRTKLVDANKNFVLEGGEAVVLLIETTNISDADLPSAYVELRGTPALVEAFKRVAPIPVPLGSLKAGEKRTTEIRGRLGQIRETIQGELIIGIILSEGLPPGSHTILTEVQPGPNKKPSSR